MQFAHKLVSDMKATTRLHKEPIKSAGFRVLRAPDVPSVLIELGYVSNKQDLQSFDSDSWRDHTATSITSAVNDYFASPLAGARAGANSGSRALEVPKRPEFERKPERRDAMTTGASCGLVPILPHWAAGLGL